MPGQLPVDNADPPTETMTNANQDLELSWMLQNTALAPLSPFSDHSPKKEALRLDQCFPLEIWEKISRYLYPSQLCRLARATRALNESVGSLQVWKKWFLKTQGCSSAPFKYLPGVTESRSYMLYLCANSLMICEGCGNQHRLDQTPVVVSPASIPLTRQAPAYFVPGTSLHLCLSCRRQRCAEYVRDPFPDDIRGVYLSKREILEKYAGRIGAGSVRSIEVRRGGGHKSGKPVTYSEQEVWKILRDQYGGDVGIQATIETVRHVESRRVQRLQELIFF
ncbi:hypothetical protein BGZ83_009820 [Gryganskiella cystojenkinii]|nr:hypothetical protein BGZ83_009820 [Gryganskiella cystojenkinii]